MRSASRSPAGRSCWGREAQPARRPGRSPRPEREVTVWSRTPKRAEELAAELGVEPVGAARPVRAARERDLGRPARGRHARRLPLVDARVVVGPGLRCRADAAWSGGRRSAAPAWSTGSRCWCARAPEASPLWTGEEAPVEVMRRAVLQSPGPVHTPRSKPDADACRYARQWRFPAPSSSPSSESRSLERRSSRFKTLRDKGSRRSRRQPRQQAADPASAAAPNPRPSPRPRPAPEELLTVGVTADSLRNARLQGLAHLQHRAARAQRDQDLGRLRARRPRRRCRRSTSRSARAWRA